MRLRKHVQVAPKLLLNDSRANPAPLFLPSPSMAAREDASEPGAHRCSRPLSSPAAGD